MSEERQDSRHGEGWPAARELLCEAWAWVQYWRWSYQIHADGAWHGDPPDIPAPGDWGAFCGRMTASGVPTSADDLLPLPMPCAFYCALCGEPGRRLDPAGVCQACRVGPGPTEER